LAFSNSLNRPDFIDNLAVNTNGTNSIANFAVNRVEQFPVTRDEGVYHTSGSLESISPPQNVS
jgi:hypothetical protein